jgi:hypothetical protein
MLVFPNLISTLIIVKPTSSPLFFSSVAKLLRPSTAASTSGPGAVVMGPNAHGVKSVGFNPAVSSADAKQTLQMQNTTPASRVPWQPPASPAAWPRAYLATATDAARAAPAAPTPTPPRGPRPQGCAAARRQRIAAREATAVAGPACCGAWLGRCGPTASLRRQGACPAALGRTAGARARVTTTGEARGREQGRGT